jgi:hypothetical protein
MVTDRVGPVPEPEFRAFETDQVKVLAKVAAAVQVNTLRLQASMGAESVVDVGYLLTVTVLVLEVLEQLPMEGTIETVTVVAAVE